MTMKMSMTTRAVGALGCLLLAAAPAHAQRCLGFPGFGGQPLRIGGELTTGDHVTTLSGDLAFGQATGSFGGVGIGVADGDGDSGSALLVSGQIGTQIQLGTATRNSSGAQLCPVAAIEYRNGPNTTIAGADVDQTGLLVRGGVALGTSLPMTPTVRFAPFGTLSVGYDRRTISVGTRDDSDSEIGGLLDLGAGFVFTNRFTVRPSVRIPLGFDDSDARFGVAVGYNFGGNR